MILHAESAADKIDRPADAFFRENVAYGCCDDVRKLTVDAILFREI